GADSSYDREERRLGAVVVVIELPALEVVETAEVIRRVTVPYLPGFLGFREGPAYCAAWRKLKNRPDVTFLDGHGIAHPRRMGLASYVGVTLDVPTIGCAKTPLFPYRLPAERRGASTLFWDEKGESVGLCLRTRAGIRPIFVSPGHRVDLMTARRVVLECSRFRIPEPLREAHRLTQHIFLS
ncbi:MAG: endonuclease V, partial [Acidobacteriota bacterium]